VGDGRGTRGISSSTGIWIYPHGGRQMRLCVCDGCLTSSCFGPGFEKPGVPDAWIDRSTPRICTPQVKDPTFRVRGSQHVRQARSASFQMPLVLFWFGCFFFWGGGGLMCSEWCESNNAPTPIHSLKGPGPLPTLCSPGLSCTGECRCCSLDFVRPDAFGYIEYCASACVQIRHHRNQ
jgi:hypothetical protein